MAENWHRIRRQEPDVMEVARRASSIEVIEMNYGEGEARRQGARCLRCNVNTVFDTSICIACNGCVDVCPEDLIRLVGLSKLAADDHWQALAEPFFGIRPSSSAHESGDLDALGAIMMKDETTCIRCAMCASRCPTHCDHDAAF